MKFMNNHYGVSRIFGRAHCVMPMNLQFFAEPEVEEPQEMPEEPVESRGQQAARKALKEQAGQQEQTLLSVLTIF